jgi:hypothetical protein
MVIRREYFQHTRGADRRKSPTNAGSLIGPVPWP